MNNPETLVVLCTEDRGERQLENSTDY